MRPISLRAPVAVTRAVPWPLTSSVPANSRVAPSANLSTGSDSPVSSDSSTCTSAPVSKQASAATRSPCASTSKSPRTTSAPAMRCATPSRTTSARGLVSSRRARSACSVRPSWYRVSDSTTSTSPNMTTPSCRSPKVRYRVPAASSSMNIGSRRVSRRIMYQVRRCSLASTLGPSCCSRWAASGAVRPSGGCRIWFAAGLVMGTPP